MNRIQVNVGAIHLSLSMNVAQKLQEKKRRYPHLPEPVQIAADFHALSNQGGVPATIKKQEGKNPQLLLYTSSYYLGAYPSDHNDGYIVSHVDVLSLSEHERLRKGVLMVKAMSWNMYQALNQFPPGNTNHWDLLWNTWQHQEMLNKQAKDEAQGTTEILTSAHENYLNTISMLIDVTRALEQDKNKLSMLIPYRKIASVGEERHALRDIYTFYLVGNPQINKKNMLRLQDLPDLHGRIHALEGNKLTVKFEGPIDRARLPDTGNFEPLVNDTIFRTQQKAVEMLRDGESKNVHLLNVLVDQKYQPYSVNQVLPKESLNSEQIDAFQRALTVPDMLLVLGPPGTGKTRTITEIAQQCGTRHQRVLITSRTHKAVDNVLERLPENLTVIRFGHEDRVAENMRHKLIDEQASELQKVILQRTTRTSDNLARFMENKKTNEQGVRQLTLFLTHLSENVRRGEQINQQRTQVMQRIGAPYEPTLNELMQSLQKQYNALNRRHKKLQTLMQKRINADARVSQPLLGFIFTWIAWYYQKCIDTTQGRISLAQDTYTETSTEQKQLREEVQHLFWADSEYRWCKDSLHTIGQEIQQLQQQTALLATTLQETIRGLVAPLPNLNELSIELLQQYVAWYSTTLLQLEKKTWLLQSWRSELLSRTDQLYPELLRYADVVGATCIGVASIKGIDDLEFDLAVVDEAGQICVSDLLVPLVRAKRAVLVGDHQQLPPFVGNEVQTWLDSLPPQTQQSLGFSDTETERENVIELLTKSTFEQLFTRNAHATHVVRFMQQGRMPHIIADFISHHFYGDRLDTFTNDAHTLPDPLFRRALTFVDTSSLTLKERQETERNASENWQETGYINSIEAGLIADIAALYEREGMEWVVIVPYRAQANAIIQQLQHRLDAIDFKLSDRVSTVDSFQGGEKNKVIYGFTRSNTWGGIGFLKELRRLNVAMTRAKQQLVLVGDISTLTYAKDADFRHVAQSLHDYVRQQGELLSFSECRKRLQRLF